MMKNKLSVNFSDLPVVVKTGLAFAVVFAVVATQGLPPVNLAASSAATNRARALFSHSFCSSSGLESATMPAPACTCILPSLMSAVRSTMQLSMSPEAEK
jgi:hypothetical protein